MRDLVVTGPMALELAAGFLAGLGVAVLGCVLIPWFERRRATRRRLRLPPNGRRWYQ